MPVAVIGTVPKMTIEHYDAIMERVSDHMWENALMHFAHRHGDGFRMVEIWPSQEKLDEFLGMIKPWLEKSGLNAEIEIVPVHNHFHKHKPHK
jgi:hypothetical protein